MFTSRAGATPPAPVDILKRSLSCRATLAERFAEVLGLISGKITELAVRDIVHGQPVKNTEALANPEALELFRDLPELSEA